MEQVTNWVRVAVDRIGGPTKAAVTFSVSGTAIYHWISANRVSDIDKAKRLSYLSGVDLTLLRSVP
jgi:hypothetical protein